MFLILGKEMLVHLLIRLKTLMANKLNIELDEHEEGKAAKFFEIIKKAQCSGHRLRIEFGAVEDDHG